MEFSFVGIQGRRERVVGSNRTVGGSTRESDSPDTPRHCRPACPLPAGRPRGIDLRPRSSVVRNSVVFALQSVNGAGQRLVDDQFAGAAVIDARRRPVGAVAFSGYT